METTKATHGHQAETPLFFFYNGKKFDATGPTMTGAAIKEAIRAQGGTFDPADTLVLEGNGAHESDRGIQDGDPVDLTIGHGEGPKHFISKPPTNFGADVAMHLTPVEAHFKRLRELYPAASCTAMSDGRFLIHIPGVFLPAG
ncbi:MAG: multiubiquitin domain-containing protein, partial [Gammaproteobacteria bacterium]|nr:multiubiquitin domain-containing protein [Gammaproteobacteria bacterium]